MNFRRQVTFQLGAKNSYEKCGQKTLMKLTAGVNFTNILQAAFSHKSVLQGFYVLTVWLCNILAK